MESRISKELHRKVFELTLALYRVSDFFPQGEVLRKQTREKANEIFGGISEYGFSPDYEQESIGIIAKIQSLRGYLEIARSLRFVKSINLTVLQREYDNLESFFENELKSAKDRTQKPEQQEQKKEEDLVREVLPTWDEFTVHKATIKESKLEPRRTLQKTEFDPEVLNDRQKRIIEHVKSNPRVRISDFFSFFSGISSKTIQRDLQDLVGKNVLKKEGAKRWTIYSLPDSIGHTSH